MFKALDKEILNRAEQIELAIFDVDGVLTNGGLILGENGNEYKAFHSRDGLGLVMLRDSGCQICCYLRAHIKHCFRAHGCTRY